MLVAVRAPVLLTFVLNTSIINIRRVWTIYVIGSVLIIMCVENEMK